MSITAAVAALTAAGYDVHTTVCGMRYITEWEDPSDCDSDVADVRAIVLPHGCGVAWLDEDLVITRETRYEVQSRTDGGEWRSDGLGDANEFITEAEAEHAISELRALGEDWASAEYRVVDCDAEPHSWKP